MAEKKLDVSSYGIYLLSIDKLSHFLKENKVKSKKVLEFFQKNHDLYLKSLDEGVWIPVLPINSIEYILKISNEGDEFSQEWENIFTHNGFNIDIVDNGVWIGSSGGLQNFDIESFAQSNGEYLSYKTLDGMTLYKSFRFNVDNGKYLVNISGFKRRHELEYPEANRGYLFEFVKIDKFEGYQDPREDDKYKFRI
jgi:hypothetical protein